MIRRALLAVAVMACLVTSAQAAHELGLWIDPDGMAYLHNITGAPVSFDGYAIASEDNKLDGVGWNSISDQVVTNTAGVIGMLGPGALLFGEANPNAGNLAEVNLGGAATLAAGGKFSIGKPFGLGGFEVEFDFRMAGVVQNSPGEIVFVPRIEGPEPSTFLLAALAGLGLLGVRAFRFRR